MNLDRDRVGLLLWVLVSVGGYLAAYLAHELALSGGALPTTPQGVEDSHAVGPNGVVLRGMILGLGVGIGQGLIIQAHRGWPAGLLWVLVNVLGHSVGYAFGIGSTGAVGFFAITSGVVLWFSYRRNFKGPTLWLGASIAIIICTWQGHLQLFPSGGTAGWLTLAILLGMAVGTLQWIALSASISYVSWSVFVTSAAFLQGAGEGGSVRTAVTGYAVALAGLAFLWVIGFASDSVSHLIRMLETKSSDVDTEDSDDDFAVPSQPMPAARPTHSVLPGRTQEAPRRRARNDQPHESPDPRRTEKEPATQSTVFTEDEIEQLRNIDGLHDADITHIVSELLLSDDVAERNAQSKRMSEDPLYCELEGWVAAVFAQRIPQEIEQELREIEKAESEEKRTDGELWDAIQRLPPEDRGNLEEIDRGRRRLRDVSQTLPTEIVEGLLRDGKST